MSDVEGASWVKNKMGDVRINVTLRRVRVTDVAVEKQQVLNVLSVCLYDFLSYSSSKADLFSSVLHCHMWPVWLDRIFSHYLINGTIFGKKKLLNIKCVF